MSAVSYTHLDVYKRQRKTLSVRLAVGGLLLGGALTVRADTGFDELLHDVFDLGIRYTSNVEFLGRTINANAVSYTHLPVRYTGKKFIADVLASGGHTFSVYAEGYQAMKGRPLSPTLPSSAVRASSGYQNSDYLVM